ncbi:MULTISPECIES: DUF4186 domain-containing protein [unclassified Caballeronia]|uniref:DUF4186 domain-containing protein n=1 Tax=unclassified Caballeronia TaxID=2646786 RepID=UPI00285BBC53|nr:MULTISPECIES: DUF4186 domain-containing protein [unclassified Caballeronia]MDR5775418.1 DUF4186 domain-containing protein [Caballeronia sp. LZ002]MDR5801733.1 DUF4186 domain-containing protein [Caballeronia sp. LZ001]MDR5850856.1 DUF4186 domain-containing protein [Caballeronia sp. LZ003]
MRDLDAVFASLAKSAFRRRFALGVREGRYLRERGVEAVVAQAHELIAKRLAPQAPLNDGKQTPFRGHPVFIAQHATATCCRGCLAKWHDIAAGKVLDETERRHVVDAIDRWLRAQPLPEIAVVEKRQGELPF